MSNLIIVESPAKAKTIERYLGENYKVLSSVGHIRDLAIKGKGGLGIDVDNDFEPTYSTIKGKTKVINELKRAAKNADFIYLATDPDREGEAISWHLAEVLDLDLKEENRIVFNEITKYGVLNGIEKPRKVDLDLVHSQEGRRIIDRIMGFKLSNLLQKKIKAKSAGRVQSVALLLIVNREKEIEAFIPIEYWQLFAKYGNYKLDYIKNSKKPNKEEIVKIFAEIEKDKKLKCAEIKTKKTTQKPKPVFTTSTFQQAASTSLGYNSKKAMMVAQKLYEGVKLGSNLEGLITYMRTDSTRLSADFIKNAGGHIKENYGEEYIGFYRFNKAKANAQDAHEGIRPTSIRNTPAKVKKYLTPDQYKIYDLIWRRTIAALMKEAKLLTNTTILQHKNGIEFKFVYTTIEFEGFKKVYDDTPAEEKALDLKLAVGEEITVDEFVKSQHFTQPPARYTEARLIKELEEKGIGRPSTYAAIIDILKTRHYVEFNEKKFFPTKEGREVTENLQNYFSAIINTDYTNDLETKLDKIAEGQVEELIVLRKFYEDFINLYEKAEEKMPKVEPTMLEEICPECGHNLVIRKGRYGEFTACSNYPTCKYIKQDEIKSYGTCPKCDEGEIVEKRTKRGKIFFACNKYPKCENAYWKLEDLEKDKK